MGSGTKVDRLSADAGLGIKPLPINRYGSSDDRTLDLLRGSNHIEFFGYLHDEGFVFGNKNEFKAELVYGNEIKKNDKIQVSGLFERRIYGSGDNEFVQRTEDYYIQPDDRSIFLIKHKKRCVAANVTLHHEEESTTEYLAGACNENFKGLGGMVIDLGRLQGIEMDNVRNIARSYGYFGIKYLLREGFKNPYFSDMNTEHVELFRNILTRLENTADNMLSFDRRLHRFYKFAPQPTRIPPKEDQLSIILNDIEDWRTMFFVREMDRHDYQELSERVLSSFSKKESM
jgi:hypothetical protein